MLPDIKGTCPFVEDSFSRFPSQSNIYGLCKADEQELLAAPLKGKVVCFRYQDLQKKIRPVSNAIFFLFSVNVVDAEIEKYVRVHGYMHFCCCLYLSVSFSSQDLGDKATPFLNIYCDYEPGSKLNLESIAQSCLNLELQFTPFQLYHIEYVIVSSETVFLLSGHDQRIPLYKENASLHQFEEQPVERLFPELPSNVLWLIVLSIEQNWRLTAFGCQNGFVGLSLVNQKGPGENGCCLEVRAFLVCCLFCTMCLVECKINVCMCVFRDVEKYGLSRQLCLAESDQCDAVVCALVADLDFDGQHELLLGTYGQDLLCYKFHQPMGAFEDKLQLLWRQSFKRPLLSLIYLDLDGDGLRELAVLTLKGLHIFQHSLRTTADLVLHILSPFQSSVNRELQPPNTDFYVTDIYFYFKGGKGR
uniref:Kaptin (actin binding protein) n=1 Tax=Sinocyclocheilus grahami TaxID=75366 RepID=A0A672PW55_SINGR